MAKRTRREFLEESMFATVAALGAASGAKVYAHQSAGGRVSPNDTINVAVVGVNGRGNAHIQGLAKTEANSSLNTVITHICDADTAVGERRAAEVAKRQGGIAPKFVQDIRQVLDDKSVHVVSIATPNHWHALASIWAMQAGKDVYVEKPISHNVSEGRRIVDASTKLNRICQTGTQGRSSAASAQAIAFIRSGGIGEVLVSRGLCYKRRPSIGPLGTYAVPSTVNYDLWSGPAPMEQPLTRKNLHYDWHWVWPTGNGDLGNQGIHQMDLARWALGVNRLPDAVISYGGRVGYVDAGTTANTQVVIMPYGKQSIVFEVRGLETGAYKGSTVGDILEGTEGYVVWGAGPVTAFDKNGKPMRTFNNAGGGGDTTTEGAPAPAGRGGRGGGGGPDAHFANFIAAVRSRRRQDLKADCLEGHLSSALCHLGNISYRLGAQVTPQELVSRLNSLKVSDNVQDTFERTKAHLADNEVDIATSKLTLGAWIDLDHANERFRNNDKANAMLTRDYRAPYVVPANAAAI
jgi:predicted dehydrogenase